MAQFIPRSAGPQVQQQLGPQARNTAQVDLSPLARTAGAVGGAATQFFQREVEKADTARLMDARTQLSEWFTGLRDPSNPDGLSKYRGEAAMGMGDELTRQLDTRISDITSSLTPAQQAQFAGIASNFRNEVRGQWAVYADKEVQGAIKAKGEAMNLALTNEAVQHGLGGDFASQLGVMQELRAANERRDQLDGVPREVTEQNSRARESEMFRKTAEGILIEDPYAAQKYLDAVRDRMQAGDLVAASRSVESKVQALELRAERERERAEAKAQREQDKRDAAAQRGMDAFYKQQAAGVPYSVEMLQRLGSLVHGTPMEAEFQGAVQAEAATQKLLTSPLDVQTAYLQQEQARINTHGGTLQEQNNLNRLKGVIEAGQKQLLETPLLFAASREGAAVTPLDWRALDDPSELTGLGGQLLERAATIDTMRKHYGQQVPMAVLLPQEVKALSESLGDMTASKQAELLAQLRATTPNDDLFSAMMGQLAPGSPVTAYAGMLSAKERAAVTLQKNTFAANVTAGARDVATTMLEGNRLLQGKGDNKFPLPPERDFREAFTSATGTLFSGRPGAADVAMQAVRAYYTGQSSAEGDHSGEVDPKRLQRAITAALGEVADVNGNGEVLAPWGMSADDFEDEAETAFTQAARAAQLPDSVANNFGAYGLRQIGERTFYVTRGREFLTGKDGKPLTITITGSGR